MQPHPMGRPRDLWSVDGAGLRELRCAIGWSQLELSCRTGISQSAISTMEKGERTWVQSRTIRRLAVALGVEAERLRLNPNGR